MAWNDPGKDKNPWGDKRRPDSPPDLDEALKKLQGKLKRFMGGGGNGGSTGQDGSPAAFGFFAGFIFLALIIIWFLSGIFIVAPAEQAVVLRLGKYKETLNEGPHWIPRVLDTKIVLNVEKLSTFSYKAQMLTKDENIVAVDVSIQYRIGNPKDYLFNVSSPDETLQQATSSALRHVVGHTKLEDILSLSREKMRDDVQTQLLAILEPYKTGITIHDVNMKPAQPPEQVKADFDDVVKAKEDEERFKNEADGYKRRIEQVAEGKAERLIQAALAFRSEKVNEANGRVARFVELLPEYKQAPRVTKDRLYIETMEEVLGKSNKILVDDKAGNNILYLPLDKLTRERAASDNRLEPLERAARVAEKSASPSTKSFSRESYSSRIGREQYSGRRTRTYR